jgi:GntR family transcriptional regulator
MLENLSLQNNGIPIYVQLRDQLSALVGRGQLAPGARLPTMREVAVALRIDLNTVQRAYGELERDGILVLVRGRGTFVAAAPRPGKAAGGADDLAARTAAQAKAQGIALGDLIAALRKLPAS